MMPEPSWQPHHKLVHSGAEKAAGVMGGQTEGCLRGRQTAAYAAEALSG